MSLSHVLERSKRMAERVRMRTRSIATIMLAPFLIGYGFSQAVMTVNVPDTSAAIKGALIKKSTFDPHTRIAQLTFVNDYPEDITAWGYCVKVSTGKKSVNSNEDFCKWSDALSSVIDLDIEAAKRPQTKGVIDCPWCHFIRAGETYTLVENYSLQPNVTDAWIIINFVAYADSNAAVL